MDRPERPGWYDDPDNPEQLRYFDGVVWTSHVTPRRTRQSSSQPPAEQVGPTPSRPDAPATPAPPPQSPWQGQPGWQQPGWQGQQDGWGAPPAPAPYAAGPTTPDGEPLAGWWKRAAARLIDWVIVFLIVLPVAFVVLMSQVAADLPALRRYLEELESGKSSATLPALEGRELLWTTLFVVFVTVVATVYEVFFTTRSGATPGKMLLGIRVRLRERPGPLPLREALVRTLLPIGGGIVGAVPVAGLLVSLLQLVDVLLPLANTNRQAIHDIMARTNVVDPRPLS